MCGKIVLVLLAVVCAVQAQYRPGDISQRAADRTRYETELKVSCDTGDDRACFELFLSLNRVWLSIAAGVVGALILVAICICCCCCCCKKKHSRLSSRA